MRKLLLLTLAAGALILLTRRTSQLGSLGAAVESLADELSGAVTGNEPDPDRANPA